LRLHNPELLDKRRVVAITKCDMIDEELREALRAELPDDKQGDGTPVPVLYISAVAGQGLTELKDVLWDQMNERSFLHR
jgi:GTP-binding protein